MANKDKITQLGQTISQAGEAAFKGIKKESNTLSKFIENPYKNRTVRNIFQPLTQGIQSVADDFNQRNQGDKGNLKAAGPSGAAAPQAASQSSITPVDNTNTSNGFVGPTQTKEDITNRKLPSPGTGEPGSYGGGENTLGGGTLRDYRGRNFSADEVRSQSGNSPLFTNNNYKPGLGTFNVVNNPNKENNNSFLDDYKAEIAARGQRLETAKANSVRTYRFKKEQAQILNQMEKIQKEYADKGYPKTGARLAKDFYKNSLGELTSRYEADVGGAADIRQSEIAGQAALGKAAISASGDLAKQDLAERKLDFSQDQEAFKRFNEDRNYRLDVNQFNFNKANIGSQVQRREDQTLLGAAGLEARGNEEQRLRLKFLTDYLAEKLPEPEDFIRLGRQLGFDDSTSLQLLPEDKRNAYLSSLQKGQ